MPTIPPWIAINPKDFIAASQAGGELGSKIASLRTESNINNARLASSERENAARVASSNANAAASRAQSQSDSDLTRAMRQWEFGQKMSQDEAQLAQTKLAEENRTALGQKNYELGESRLGMMDRRQDEVERQARDREDRPQLRVVENQLVEYNPLTGDTTSVFTAPFRPTSGSVLEQLLAGGNTSGTATNNIPPIKASAPTNTATEVIRTTKDGRRVVYDAETKEPLRYAE